jgi:hypothetical protein
MHKCCKCDTPLTQQHVDNGQCPACSTSIEFDHTLRESTLDVAAQHQRHEASDDAFNVVPVAQGDIAREQTDQLREEEQDLDYRNESENSDDEDEDDEVDSTVGSSAGRPLAATSEKHCEGKAKGKGKGGAASKDAPRSSKLKGKFVARIMTRKQPPKGTNGKERTQVCGQVAECCPMDEKRLAKIHKLMAKHNNFANPDDLDDPEAMVDHFECLMIVAEASTKNSHGKGSRYPRFLRDYVGPGKCYLYHSEITRSSQVRAHAFIEDFVRTVKIHTQNVNVKGTSVPAMQAPLKAREAKIRHLVNSHKHGIDDYLDLLDKLREGTIQLPPPPSADAATPSARSIASSVGRPRGCSSEAGPSQPSKRVRYLADPNSPTAMGLATIPGLDSDDDAEDGDAEDGDDAAADGLPDAEQ